MATEGDSAALIKFAQRLAGNEKKWRDYSLKKLHKWLESRSTSKKGGLSSDDMMKIWKGLHYCMWMSDKPLVQEELADRLSKLIHCFSRREQALLFVDAFFKTEAREWPGIDRLRLDKFMMLIRRTVHQSFMLVKRSKWSAKVTKQATDVFSKCYISGKASDTPDGLRYHMADIYLDELEKVALNEINEEQFLRFLDPYCKMLGETANKPLFKYIIKNVFDVVIGWEIEKASRMEKEENEDSEDSDAENSDDEIIERLPVDLTALAEMLFTVASGKSCLERNRKTIYKIVAKCKDVASGIYHDQEVEQIGLEENTDDEIEKAANELIAFEKKLMGTKQKGARKRSSDDSADTDAPKKKKKKKLPKPEGEESAEVTTGKLATKEKTKGKKTGKVKTNGNKSLENHVESSKSDPKLNDSIVTPGKKKKKNKGIVNDNMDTLEDGLQNGHQTHKDSSNIFSAVAWSENNVKQETEVVKNAKKRRSLQSGGDVFVDPENTDKKKRRKSLPASLIENESSEFKSKHKKGKSPNHMKSLTKDMDNSINEEDANTSEILTPKKKKKKNKPEAVALSPEVVDIHVGTNGKEGESKLVTPKGKKLAESPDGSLSSSKKKKKAKKVADSIEDASEEVEIWIPNKNYKGPLKQSPSKVDSVEVNSNEAKFASFQKIGKTPPAFVRRAIDKVTPLKKETPKKLRVGLPQTPNTDSKRRVSFVLSQNKAQEFEDSLTLSPALPFDPKTKPEMGILKGSPMASPQLTTPKMLSAKKRRRSNAADFF